MNQHISLLLLTKNEQDNIKTNFAWLKKCPIINEIVVIDDLSNDDTKKTIKKLKNKNINIVFKTRQLNDDFSTQRNYGTSLTKNNWVLWLDADEVPSQDLINFINNFQPKNSKTYYFLRQNIFWGKSLNHGEGSQHVLRLFDKRFGKFTGKVHEIWQTKAKTITTNIKIYHYTSQDISSLLKKINFYTDIRAKELFLSKTTVSIWQIIIYPIAKFIQNYFLKLAFLDGTQGAIISILMSFHSFLVRTKLWQQYNQSSSI